MDLPERPLPETPPAAPLSWRRRWQTALLAAFLLVALAVGAAEFVDVTGDYRRAEQAALTRQAETAQALASATELFVGRYADAAQLAGRMLAFAPPTPGVRREVVTLIRRTRPEIRAAVVTDREGRAVYAEPPGAVGTDYSGRLYFQRLRDGASAVVSDLMMGKFLKAPVLPVTAAIRGPDGIFRGAVMLGLPVEELGRTLGLRLSGGAYPVVVDRTGRIVVHGLFPALDWEARDASRLPLVGETLAGRAARSSRFRGPLIREPALGAMVPAPALGWAVGVFQPVETALAPARRELRFSLTVFAVVLALGAFLALLLSGRLSRPLAALDAGVAALATGDLGYRIRGRWRNEFGRLAESFDQMAARLEAARAQEQALNAELAAANEELQVNAMQMEESLSELEAANQSLDEALAQVQTERQRLETTLQALPDAVLVCDADGILVVANDAARRLLGDQYVPGLPLAVSDTLRPATRSLDGDPVPPDQLPLRRALRGERVIDQRLAIERAPGALRYVSATAAPVPSRTGEPLGAVTVVRDVTEQQTLEVLKDQFIARASHELRTPVTAIHGTFAFLRRALAGGRAPDAPEKLLAIAARNVEQLIRLIDDLLDASRLQSGRTTLNLERLGLREALAQVVEQLAPAAREKQIALSVRAEAGGTLEADPLKLEQVLTNLVGNAIKFTPEAGTVTVEGRPAGDQVRIEVRDSGPGLAPEHLEKVFDPFFQVYTGARPGRARGTGLGLTIARSLVELHGGRVWAESGGLGTGSTFVVTLPRACPRPQAA